jgi:hypothetical protein
MQERMLGDSHSADGGTDPRPLIPGGASRTSNPKEERQWI